MEDQIIDGFREELQARIKYLTDTEFEELKAIDAKATGTIERDMAWKLIRELCMRRQELQDTLKMYDKHKKTEPQPQVNLRTEEKCNFYCLKMS